MGLKSSFAVINARAALISLEENVEFLDYEGKDYEPLDCTLKPIIIDNKKD